MPLHEEGDSVSLFRIRLLSPTTSPRMYQSELNFLPYTEHVISLRRIAKIKVTMKKICWVTKAFIGPETSRKRTLCPKPKKVNSVIGYAY